MALVQLRGEDQRSLARLVVRTRTIIAQTETVLVASNTVGQEVLGSAMCAYPCHSIIWIHC